MAGWKHLQGQGRAVGLGLEQPLQHHLVEVALRAPDQELVELRGRGRGEEQARMRNAHANTHRPSAKPPCMPHTPGLPPLLTLTSSFRYTLSLFGAVLCTRVFLPPFSMSTPCVCVGVCDVLPFTHDVAGEVHRQEASVQGTAGGRKTMEEDEAAAGRVLQGLRTVLALTMVSAPVDNGFEIKGPNLGWWH